MYSKITKFFRLFRAVLPPVHFPTFSSGVSGHVETGPCGFLQQPDYWYVLVCDERASNVFRYAR